MEDLHENDLLSGARGGSHGGNLLEDLFGGARGGSRGGNLLEDLFDGARGGSHGGSRGWSSFSNPSSPHHLSSHSRETRNFSGHTAGQVLSDYSYPQPESSPEISTHFSRPTSPLTSQDDSEDCVFVRRIYRRRSPPTSTKQIVPHRKKKKKTRSRPREQRTDDFPRSVVSIPMSPEIIKLKEELSKCVVINVTAGQISRNALQTALPAAFGLEEVGTVFQFGGDNSFIVSLTDADQVKMVCALGEFQIFSRRGLCTVSFSQWTEDIGSVGAARGVGVWVNIWNLPLHCWCWRVVAEVLRPVGDLVTISKRRKINQCSLTVLVRVENQNSFPLEVELDVGTRSYEVLITEVKAPLPVFLSDLHRYVLADPDPGTVEDERKTRRGSKFAASPPLSSEDVSGFSGTPYIAVERPLGTERET